MSTIRPTRSDTSGCKRIRIFTAPAAKDLRSSPQTLAGAYADFKAAIPSAMCASAALQRSRESTSSLMPDGLLDVLQPSEVKDLIAYLMSPQQVRVPPQLKTEN